MKNIGHLGFSVLSSVLMVVVIAIFSPPVEIETTPLDIFPFEEEFTSLSSKGALNSVENKRYRSLIEERNEFNLEQMKKQIRPSKIKSARLKQLNGLNIPLSITWGAVYYFLFRQKSNNSDFLILIGPFFMVLIRLITLQLFLILSAVTLSLWIYFRLTRKSR